MASKIFSYSHNAFQSPPLKRVINLALTVPFTKIVVIAFDVDQDQAAQNVQPDL